MRKYYNDSYVKNFTSEIVREEISEDGRVIVVLNETYFYPTSGGQPNDLGTIAGVKVLDVIDGNEILHVVEKPINREVVECEIDWARRFDHMQQHAGQHILSACFEKLCNAETVGFHLGEEYVTIDLTLDQFSIDTAKMIEDKANQFIYQNLAIRTYFIEPERIKELPLRKPPIVSEDIRIVEVEEIDFSPCGGTHPRSTGEIGIIKIRKWEKKRDNIRVEFICGLRALRDYQWKNQQINDIANRLSCKDSETSAGFSRIFDEAKSMRRELGKLKEKIQGYEAAEFYQNAVEIKGVRIISQIFDDRNLGEIKKLANKIIAKDKAIVLFAVKGEKAQVSFCRSEDVEINMNDLLKEVVGLIDGSGGGNPKSAQGGGTTTNNLESLITAAELILKNRYLT